MKQIDESNSAAVAAALDAVLARHDKYALIVVRGTGGSDGKPLADTADLYTNAWRGVVWVKGNMPQPKWDAWVGGRSCRAVAIGIDAGGVWHAADWLADTDDDLRINEAFGKAAQVGGN